MPFERPVKMSQIDHKPLFYNDLVSEYRYYQWF